jgi:zinc transport system permease protein
MVLVTPAFLDYAFMQRALVAAVLVGLTAPSVGIYLVQRRLALMGDGIGHVALTGVAIGLLTGTQPVYTAVLAAVAGAVTIELLRERGRTSGDVALAMLFYGGIAGGVMLIGFSESATTANLTGFLFGQLTSVSGQDLLVIAVLGLFVLVTTIGLSRRLFAVCQDEEYARVAGLHVRLLNLLLAVTAAVTVTVALRVVGVLLVSALMVVPVATAQQLCRGFRATFALALLLGVLAAVSGVVTSYYADTASGATIVVLSIAGFLLATLATAARRRFAGGQASLDPDLVPL